MCLVFIFCNTKERSYTYTTSSLQDRIQAKIRPSSLFLDVSVILPTHLKAKPSPLFSAYKSSLTTTDCASVSPVCLPACSLFLLSKHSHKKMEELMQTQDLCLATIRGPFKSLNVLDFPWVPVLSIYHAFNKFIINDLSFLFAHGNIPNKTCFWPFLSMYLVMPLTFFQYFPVVWILWG